MNKRTAEQRHDPLTLQCPGHTPGLATPSLTTLPNLVRSILTAMLVRRISPRGVGSNSVGLIPSLLLDPFSLGAQQVSPYVSATASGQGRDGAPSTSPALGSQCFCCATGPVTFAALSGAHPTGKSDLAWAGASGARSARPHGAARRPPNTGICADGV